MKSFKEALDPVNPKAVKKKFDDRKDKDIDNDGDVDSSDEYLHKRRKAVSKAIGEAVEIAEARWEYKGNTSYMVGGNLRYDDKIEYKLSKANADILNKYMKQAKSDAERSKVWTMFWDSKETGDKAKGPDAAIAFAKKAIKEEVELKAIGVEEAYKGKASDFKYDVEMAVDNIGISQKAIKKILKKGKGYEVRLSSYMDKSTHEKIAKEIGATLVDYRKDSSMTIGIYEAVEQLDELSPDTMDRYSKKAKMSSDRARNSATAKIVRQGDKADYSKEKDTIRKREKGMAMAKSGQVRAFRKQMGYDKKNEEVELEENYTINHKTFSAAVQHAKSQVEKKGYTIDDDEWDRKVAMGPRKPGKGKTNRYTIALMKGGKETKRNLQMQVYYDEGRYELNMYVS